MGRVYVFADEAGDFNFSHGPGASRYFILTTVTLTDCAIGNDVLELRRQLAWEGLELTEPFHATEERQAVRDRVYALLAKSQFRIDSTIFDKPKAQPHLRRDEATFYQYVWLYHFQYVARQVASPADELLVIAASLGTRKNQAVFHRALQNAVAQVITASQWRTAFWTAATDPCLQVADYCCWAIQRKWERRDERSYILIKDKVASEFDIFRFGAVTYY